MYKLSKYHITTSCQIVCEFPSQQTQTMSLHLCYNLFHKQNPYVNYYTKCIVTKFFLNFWKDQNLNN